MISTYLRGDRNLKPEAAAALEAVIKVTYERLGPRAEIDDVPARLQERGEQHRW